MKKYLFTLIIIALLTAACSAEKPTLTPTETPAPAATDQPAAPTEIPTPEIENEDADVTITFIGNEGFMIAAGEKKILIDAFFWGVDKQATSPQDVERMVNAQPPYDGIDLILATHAHDDHFDPRMIGGCLESNPGAIFVSTEESVSKLQERYENFDAVQDRARGIHLERGASQQLVLNGIALEILPLPHDHILNLGFIVNIGGFKLLHMGDFYGRDVEAALTYLQVYALPEKEIDLAFVSYGYLTTPEQHPIVLQGVQARHVIPMHFNPKIGFAAEQVQASFPDAIVLNRDERTWTLSHSPPPTATPPAPTNTPPAEHETPQSPIPLHFVPGTIVSNISSPLVLVGGTLIDGTGAEPLPDAVLVIQGERIVAVGPRGEVELPPDARRVDLPEGARMLPGFVNAHVHNAYQERHLKTWAQEGVTTVRDVGAPLGFPFFSTRDQLRANPELARIVAAGPLVTVPEGYPIAWNDFPSLTVTSPEDARQKINQLFEDGADLIKITLESSAGPILSPEEAAAIVETAHEWGAPVTAHVTRPDDLLRALDAGVDDIAHIVPDRVSDEVLRHMVEMGVYWVPTFAAFDGRGSNNLSRFMAFGGQVALGNDGGYLEGLEIGIPMREIELMQSAGMTPMDVIVAATRNAAHVCRLSDSLGTLQVGKLADVLVVEGDPLQDLHALEDVLLVVHGGGVIRGEVGE